VTFYPKVNGLCKAERWSRDPILDTPSPRSLEFTLISLTRGASVNRNFGANLAPAIQQRYER
jgi:hypothetical protein